MVRWEEPAPQTDTRTAYAAMSGVVHLIASLRIVFFDSPNNDASKAVAVPLLFFFDLFLLPRWTAIPFEKKVLYLVHPSNEP